MTLFFLVRLPHLAAMILWLGGGLSIPVARDLRRSLALELGHGEALVARLSTITAQVIPAGFTTLLTDLHFEVLPIGLFGLVCIVAALGNAEVFYRSARARVFTRLLGRTALRAVYGLTGVFEVAFAVWGMTR